MVKGLGVRVGAFSLYLPSLFFAFAGDRRGLRRARQSRLAAGARSLLGLASSRAAPRGPVVAGLPRRRRACRANPRRIGAAGRPRPRRPARRRRRGRLTPALLARIFRWDLSEAEQVLRGLGFTRIRKGKGAEGGLRGGHRRRPRRRRRRQSRSRRTPRSLRSPSQTPPPHSARGALRPGAALGCTAAAS